MFALVCDRVIPEERQSAELASRGGHQTFACPSTPRVLMGLTEKVLAQRVQPGTQWRDIKTVTRLPKLTLKLTPNRSALTLALPLTA